MISNRILLLSIALLNLNVTPVLAQYNGPGSRGPKNFEVGYSYCVASADFRYSENNFNEQTGIVTDTSFFEHLTSKSGFGAFGGYYWPVTKMGKESRLAIDLTYMYNAYLWEGSTFSYSSNSRTGPAESNVGSATVELALPVGVEYKYGCDALQDKSRKFCASFGAGVYPSMDATVYKSEGGFGFHARPYLKGELGFFAGICFKVRATYVAGKINYIDYGDSGAGYENSTTFKSKSTIALSLVLMPFSWKWQKAEWWN